MANLEQVALLHETVDAWNEWRAKNPKTPVDLREGVLIGCDLRQADLVNADMTGVHLAGAYLNRARLTGAVLSGARLFRAHMGGAELQGANLEGADLGGANLGDANLEGASLRGALLRGTNFYGARLDNADFEKAQVGRTIFGNVDLTTVKGLLLVEHVDPSTIGLDTLIKSKGNIPDDFLEGAGIPKDIRNKLAAIFKR